VAGLLAEAGADLILGHHPHVLQPVELIGAGARRTLVAYSMGNFISNQDRMYRADRSDVAGGDSRDGVAVQCRLVKRRLADGSEQVLLEQPVCEPLWTQNNWAEFSSGKARLREIRVAPVNAAIAAIRAELEQMRDTDPAGLRERQSLLNTLELRRRRAMDSLGPGFVKP
jgi:poly-gamma-glutamate synthesis protein (capsule biosynthesis protein)